ncbi:uroporphyrinogen-III synthase [Falsibacillus pallidus]|uniref:uroporphyrinogen-III synthase n=1 Tax=Falsibacillus pallidus TaxID=493781 RepID=UPI003D9794C2
MNLSQNPLKGWDILITRNAEQGKGLSEMVLELGGKPVHIPMIEFCPSEGTQELYLKKISDYDWIIFTSATTVRFFFKALEKNHVPIPATMKWAAVGDKTKKILQNHGIEPDFVPKKFSAEDFVEEFRAVVKGGNILFPHGNLARNIIPEGLRDEGFIIDDWTIYETFFPEASRGKLKDWLRNCNKAVATFTSPSTVRNFMKIIHSEGLGDTLSNLTAACIGPVTAKELKRFGVNPRICPPVYTTEAMVNEMLEYIQKNEEEDQSWN